MLKLSSKIVLVFDICVKPDILELADFGNDVFNRCFFAKALDVLT